MQVMETKLFGFYLKLLNGLTMIVWKKNLQIFWSVQQSSVGIKNMEEYSISKISKDIPYNSLNGIKNYGGFISKAWSLLSKHTKLQAGNNVFNGSKNYTNTLGNTSETQKMEENGGDTLIAKEKFWRH